MSPSPFPWRVDHRVKTAVFDANGIKIAATKEGHAFLPIDPETAADNAALIAAIPAMVEALRECAAPFSTSPGSLSQCQTEVNAEFKRRMNIAAHGLAVLASIGKMP